MEQVIAKVIEAISNPQVILFAGVVVEMIFRFVKTDKPKSILIMIADGGKVLGNGLVAVSSFLDKIVGQRLK